jgi:hypothetical protein
MAAVCRVDQTAINPAARFQSPTSFRRLALVTFFPGMRRVAGSGRKPGTPNRGTELMRKRVQSATATFRDSPQLVQEVANFLRGVATARTKGMTPEQIAALPREELALLQSFLVEAANIALKSMEYSYPKLARVDHIGEAPSVPTGHKVIVTLKLGDLPRPALSARHDIEGHTAPGTIGDGGDNGGKGILAASPRR